MIEISGSKMWISGAKEAGLLVVFANAKPEAGYKGISCFIMDAREEGIAVGKKESKVNLAKN